jgi:hypothetical protein
VRLIGRVGSAAMGKVRLSALAALGACGTWCLLAVNCGMQDIVFDLREDGGAADCQDAGEGGASAGDADTDASTDRCDPSAEGLR